MIRNAVIEYLKENAGVHAVVGDRIYPLFAPSNQETFPIVTVHVDSTVRGHSKDGPTGLAERIVRIVIWTPRILDAERAANAIRQALDGFQGDMQGVTIKSVRNTGENDDFIPEVDEAVISMEFTITHEE